MEIRLLKEGDPFLTQKADAYDFIKDGDPSELVKLMTTIMFEHNGIGLAAPQVNVGKRLFIMGNQDKLIVCINPEILEGTGNVKDIEGCLSFPKLWLRVNRYETIKVKYQNITGEYIEQTLSGLAARVYQHESEHLDGICFDTKVGPVTLDLAKEKRRRKSR